jgi:hypothetical protein
MSPSRSTPLLLYGSRRASSPPSISYSSAQHDESRRPVFVRGTASARELPVLQVEESTSGSRSLPVSPTSRSWDAPLNSVRAKHTKTFDTKLPDIKCVSPSSSFPRFTSTREPEPLLIRRQSPVSSTTASRRASTAINTGASDAGSFSRSFEHASYRKARVGDLIAECARDYYANMRKEAARPCSHSESDVLFALQHGTIRV